MNKLLEIAIKKQGVAKGLVEEAVSQLFKRIFDRLVDEEFISKKSCSNDCVIWDEIVIEHVQEDIFKVYFNGKKFNIKTQNEDDILNLIVVLAKVHPKGAVDVKIKPFKQGK